MYKRQGKFSIKPDVCIAKQMARFYGLSHLGHDLCCSHLHGIPDDVSHLYRYLKGEVGPRVEEVGSSLGDGIGNSNANSDDNSLSFGNESSVFEDYDANVSNSDEFDACLLYTSRCV